LNYELDTYLDALQGFPDNCDNIQVAKGNALLIKKDIFKNLMWYVLPDSNKQYPVTIERVRKIKSLNGRNYSFYHVTPHYTTLHHITPHYTTLHHITHGRCMM